MITDFGISVRHKGRLLGGLLLATAPRIEWAKLRKRSFGTFCLPPSHAYPGRMRALLLVSLSLLMGCASAEEWTDEREQDAIRECQRLVQYQSDACFAAAFCQCAVPDYKRRGDTFTALSASCYCTDAAESRCPAGRQRRALIHPVDDLRSPHPLGSWSSVFLPIQSTDCHILV